MAKKVYIGELERFGYTLTAVDTSKKRVVDALMAEYVETYKDYNGTDPRREKDDYSGFTYYRDAKECIEIRELEIGKVEWC